MKNDIFCPNEHCHAKGHVGKGNIIVHSKRDNRFYCKECKRTFSGRKGTLFYRRKLDEATIVLIVGLLSYGCPASAIEQAFRIDGRTVRSLESGAGEHCKRVHEHSVEKPLQHTQIQVDEMWAKLCGAIVWIAMAISVDTRLWLGASVGHKRNRKLINSILSTIKCCVIGSCLIVTDGFSAYIQATRKAFSTKVPRKGKPGRCRLSIQENICLAQVIKSYTKKGKRYTCHGVSRCLVAIGAFAQVSRAVTRNKTSVLNTSYIERLNATFRQRLAGLIRRGRCIWRKKERAQAAVYLLGTVYNFCSIHQSLKQTPAMAAGITSHIWSIDELLKYKVPPSIWTPSKKRGRISKSKRQLIARWAGKIDHG